MHKRFFLIILLIPYVFKALGQDSIVSNDSSSYRRFIEIMKEYTDTAFFIDTSDYVQDDPEALNINLMTAASKGYCYEIARLIFKGANINCRSGERATPLHFAVADGKHNAAEILLLLGASTDAQDIYGKQPLLIASENNDLEMADLLIIYGANTDTSDFRMVTPLHRAVSNGNFEMTDMLIFHNARLDVVDKEGNTPLMIAVWRSFYDIADLLLQAGADPNKPDKKGFTPLMLAAQEGDTLMMSILQKAGSDLYAFNQSGCNALCLAMEYNQTDAVNYLLKAGQQWFEQKEGIADPEKLTMKYGNKNINVLKNRSNKHIARNICFDQISFSAGGLTTNHLALLKGGISVKDQKLHAGIFTSYSFNPVSSKVLVEKPEAIYQFRLKINTIEAGLFKEFPFYNNSYKGKWSLVTSFSGAYHFYSEYNGTTSQPENKFCIIPSAGLQWTIGKFDINSYITYIKTPFYKMSPIWVGLKLSFSFYADRSYIPGKRINIYNNGQ